MALLSALGQVTVVNTVFYDTGATHCVATYFSLPVIASDLTFSGFPGNVKRSVPAALQYGRLLRQDTPNPSVRRYARTRVQAGAEIQLPSHDYSRPAAGP